MTKIEWRLVNKKLQDLDPHPANPRKLTSDQHKQLTESLTKFGVAEKPIVNKNNTIIGGHQRIKVMRELGIHDIDCWVPSRVLSKSEVDEMCIRLNKNVGEFDYDILANQWDVDDLIEWGFNEKDFDIDDDTVSDEQESISADGLKHTCPKCGHEY